MSADEHLGPVQFKNVVEAKMKRGYELPDWHQPVHSTPEGAANEHAKLREWSGDSGAIKSMKIRVTKDA
jgi:hypothetical protein